VMGTLLLLTTLGVAIGISAADPGETDPGAFGTAAAIWTSVSLLIALFIGGMASTRLGMVYDKAAGTFEGALVWVLSFLMIFWLAGSGVSLIASGVSGIFSGVTQTVGVAVSGNIDELTQGEPQQILSRLRDPATAQTVAAATGMPEDQVRAEIAQLEQRVQQAQNDPSRVAQEVREATTRMVERARAEAPRIADRVKPAATRTAWITLFALVLSLLAAIGGAMLGRRKAFERLAQAESGVVR